MGDTVYLDNQEYQITELREDTVQLLPSNMASPIYRAESQELSLIHISTVLAAAQTAT